MIGQALSVLLSCTGVASIPTSERATTSAISPGGQPIYGSARINGHERRDVEVRLEFTPEASRIRLPSGMTPGFASRSDEGWRPVTVTAVSPEKIEGEFTFNFANKPKVTIDRMTGDLTIHNWNIITGVYHFEGRCTPSAAPTAPLF